MTRKMEIFLLVVVFVNMVTGDPVESFCCKPGQGILAEEGKVCVDIKHNVTSKTKLSCEKVDVIEISSLNFTVSDDGSLLILIDGMEPQVDKET